jgi:hypothetical protein
MRDDLYKARQRLARLELLEKRARRHRTDFRPTPVKKVSWLTSFIGTIRDVLSRLSG